MRILVTAGEPSGDLHAAHVIAALRRIVPEAEIEAVGGPAMAAAGANILRGLDGLGAMGFVEIIHSIPTHYALLRDLRRRFVSHRYDLLIAVDYPGFHLRVAEAARANRTPVLWYIAPQHWAWRPERATRFAAAVDRLAVILPFEAGFFRRAGIDATHVGHPLLDQEPPPERAVARRAIGIPQDARVLALFPGSRRGELARLWPAYRDAALSLLSERMCSHVVVAATEWGSYPGAGPIILVRDGSARVLAAADAVFAKSGTTTLQAALADVPMVVAYRINRFSVPFLRRMLTVPWVSLVNLICERQVVPELLQNEVTATALADAMRPLLVPESLALRLQREGLAQVRERLGGPGASDRVARLAVELLAA